MLGKKKKKSQITTRHQRRYQKAKSTIYSYKTFKSIFSSKHISEKFKESVFAKYLESIFMYNSELWMLTQTLKNSIDVFQR